MKFGYLFPGIGLEEKERLRRKRILASIGPAGTDFQLLEVNEGPQFIETHEDQEKAIGPIVALAKAHEEVFDAFIIGCFGDVGIAQLRESVRIPVVGPARASYAAAAALFPSFSVIALNEDSIMEEEEMAKNLGVHSSITHIRAVNLRVSSIITDPDEALKQIAGVVREINDVAVLPGCMGMAFLLQERAIREFQGVHVVNPLQCAGHFAVAALI